MTATATVRGEFARRLFRGAAVQAVYDGSGKNSTGRAWQRRGRGQNKAV